MLYQYLLRPLLFQLDPETAHNLTLRALRWPPLSRLLRLAAPPKTPGLEKTIWGLRFPHPIGLAAGLDKNGMALHAWENLGFAFAEIGTITPRPQQGNPRPRLFRIPSCQSLINRVGLPNLGAVAIRDHLALLKQKGHWPSTPVGINIGKMKETSPDEAPADYLFCFQTLLPYADYFVINVSSPNMPGLRDFQEKKRLALILRPLVEANRTCPTPRPLLVKIAPDLSYHQIAQILECVYDCQLHGIVATNTTLDKSAVPCKEAGGLSGPPLQESSNAILHFISQETKGKLPLIGVGGITTADDAQAKLDAGASLLQLYTSFVYQGPSLIPRLCRDLQPKKA